MISNRLKSKIFSFTAFFLALGIILLTSELLVLFLNPQPTLFPRFMYSNEYGQLLFPNTKMIHHRPRHFHYEYTINEKGYRGPYLEPNSAKDAIVVLGDSYSFGIGVTDNEEYPHLLGKALKNQRHVINLAVPSWGLTQHIRRYFEFGVFYNPQIVILQFCKNDPDDNLKNEVTALNGEEFNFKDSNSQINWIKKYLSQSSIQKSQFYNFIRQSIFLWMDQKITAALNKTEGLNAGAPSLAAQKYAELLAAFATHLNKAGGRLILISVQGELEEFPHIIKMVEQLERENKLTYYDTRAWLKNEAGYESAEGHRWGKKAHAVIAENLAGVIPEMQK